MLWAARLALFALHLMRCCSIFPAPQVLEVRQIVKAGLFGRIAADVLSIVGLRNKILFHGGKLAMAAVWGLRTHRRVKSKECSEKQYVLPGLAALYVSRRRACVNGILRRSAEARVGVCRHGEAFWHQASR